MYCSALALLLLLFLFFFDGFFCARINLDGTGSSSKRHWHIAIVTGLIEALLACGHEKCDDTFTTRSISLIVGVAAIRLAPGLGLFLSDRTVHIHLVSHYDEGEALRVLRGCLVKEILLPEVEALKTLFIAYVKGEDAAITAAIECKTDGSVLLLASCIPDLECNLLSINSDCLGLEISSNSGRGVT